MTDMVTSISLPEFTNERKDLIQFLGIRPKRRPDAKPDLELEACQELQPLIDDLVPDRTRNQA